MFSCSSSVLLHTHPNSDLKNGLSLAQVRCIENVHEPSDMVMERGYAQVTGVETAEEKAAGSRRATWRSIARAEQIEKTERQRDAGGLREGVCC